MNKTKLGTFDAGEASRLRGEPADMDTKATDTKSNIPLVEEAREQSVQERAKDSQAENGAGADINTWLSQNVSQLFQVDDTLPPWWSIARDRALADMWRSSNLLSGAMYAMTSKMSTIPFHIEARDMSITKHQNDANMFERRLKESAEFGNGWGQFFEKQVESLLGQDNGRFMEIIDLSKNKVGPLTGPAISVAHLDPSRCTRMTDPIFPVRYEKVDGTLHKLHWTRVAFQAQLPSERADMLGVGTSAVSRATSYAQNMLDIARYKQEKLGSRPLRGIMLVGGGLDAKATGVAFQRAALSSDNRGNRRFSQLPIIGSPDIKEPSLELISLSQLPDGFDEKDATDIAMAVISLAFGVDARELWPGMQSASTRADALLSHIKQRGKGPGHILQETERMFNNWFLPPYLKMVFDFQDDAQDRQKAEIKRERSMTRKTDLETGTTDIRTERETMLKEKGLTQAQFRDLELADGRLTDGTPLETVFFRIEPIYITILTLPGVADPLDLRSNDPLTVLDAISTQLPIAIEIIATEKRLLQQKQAIESHAALLFLREEYNALIVVEEAQTDLTSRPTRTVAQTDREAQAMRQKRPPQSDSTTTSTNPGDDEQRLTANENSPRDLTGKQQRTKKKVITKTVLSYTNELRQNARILYNEEATNEFFSLMLDTIVRNISAGWFAGMKQCGFVPADITEAEDLARINLINNSTASIPTLTDFILDLKRDNKPVTDSYARLNIWSNRFNEAFVQAQTMACADKKFIWILGDTDHCKTCLRMSGKVKRASFWEDSIKPQSSALECGGWNCQCRLVPTDAPLSRGPLPSVF